MVLKDEHIAYLYNVESGYIILSDRKYWHRKSASELIPVDHLIALAAEMLGLTHVIFDKKTTVVALTARGKSILEDEREAWG